MIKEMINNMLGEYSKFIQIQDDGTVKVFVPEDVNNPSMKNATELTLSKNEAISLMGLNMLQASDLMFNALPMCLKKN